MTDLVMVIDGHDMRYTGHGWEWLPVGHPEHTGTWGDLRRVGYQRKECMTCGFTGAPDASMPACHIAWSDRTGHPSSKDGSTVYWPTRPGEIAFDGRGLPHFTEEQARGR
jgi:hypothetical protein